jgi:hypothetical protein
MSSKYMSGMIQIPAAGLTSNAVPAWQIHTTFQWAKYHVVIHQLHAWVNELRDDRAFTIATQLELEDVIVANWVHCAGADAAGGKHTFSDSPSSGSLAQKFQTPELASRTTRVRTRSHCQDG